MKTRCCNSGTHDEEIMVECCDNCGRQDPDLYDDTPVTITKDWIKGALELAQHNETMMRVRMNSIEPQCLAITKHIEKLRHLLEE